MKPKPEKVRLALIELGAKLKSYEEDEEEHDKAWLIKVYRLRRDMEDMMEEIKCLRSES
jgi:hypothetical protein